MLNRILTGALGVTAAVGMAGSAAADPTPTPTPTPVLPNVNVYTPISPVDYTVMGGNWYAFAGPPVTCVITQNTTYGCSGPLPGAPGGANLVSAGGPVSRGSPPPRSRSSPLPVTSSRCRRTPGWASATSPAGWTAPGTWRA